MLFNSIHFFVFFPLVVSAYFLLPHRYRWILLLISSYYFYMSTKAEYAILLLISTVMDYVASIYIHKSSRPRIRKLFLTLSLSANLGLLFAFKYVNFFSESARAFLSIFAIDMPQIVFNIILPVGISFYTFQTMSYTIDVYRGKVLPMRHFGIFALYVSFFPQLVAGPIERAGNLLPQFLTKHSFDTKRIGDGLKLMLWGMFKKVVIADRLAVAVDAIYSDPSNQSSIPLMVATFFFAIQIYCDFSGYSDIAIGAAKVMGFNLMDNFRRPYYSVSLAEFWQRWHISLSTWFRDYLYFPIVGYLRNTRFFGNPRHVLLLASTATFTVFFMSGLWHGAAWTFVIWGALHGVYLIFERATAPFWRRFSRITTLNTHHRLQKVLRMLITFTFVNFAYIFFRAQSLSDALTIITNIFTRFTLDLSGTDFLMSYPELFFSMALIVFLEAVHLTQEHGKMRTFLDDKPLVIRWSTYLILLLAIIFTGAESVQFIYFQF